MDFGDIFQCIFESFAIISSHLPKCTCDPEWTGVTCSGKSCDKPGVCVDAHTIACDDSDGYAICNCYSGYIGVDCAFDQTGGGMG